MSARGTGCLPWLTPAFAQDAKLIEAAKKDGKLIVYGTMQSDIFELLQKSFHKRTGVAIDYWRTSATKVMERALTEARAGKALFDLVMSTEDTQRIMLKEGILAKYAPASKYNDGSKLAQDNIEETAALEPATASSNNTSGFKK